MAPTQISRTVFVEDLAFNAPSMPQNASQTKRTQRPIVLKIWSWEVLTRTMPAITAPAIIPIPTRCQPIKFPAAPSIVRLEETAVWVSRTTGDPEAKDATALEAADDLTVEFSRVSTALTRLAATPESFSNGIDSTKLSCSMRGEVRRAASLSGSTFSNSRKG